MLPFSERQSFLIQDAKSLPGYQGWTDDDIFQNINDVMGSGDSNRINSLTADMGALPGYSGWNTIEITDNVSEIFKPQKTTVPPPLPEPVPLTPSYEPTSLLPEAEPSPVSSLGIEQPEPLPELPRITTDPESAQVVAEEMFGGEPEALTRDVSEGPKGTLEGLLARTGAQTLSLAAHAPSFIVDVGQSIAEKVIPAVSSVDESTKAMVDEFNKQNFPQMQEIKNKYKEQYLNAKTDEEIKKIQRKIVGEVYADRLKNAKAFALERGLNEDVFVSGVKELPAGKQYALEIADVAYNNPAAKLSKNILEKYPSPEEIFGGGVVDTFKESPLKGLQYMGLAGLENIGNLVLFAVNAPAGLVTIGLGAAGERAKELRDKDIEDGKRLLNATGYGLAESIPEMFGSAAIVGRLKDAFKTTAKELGKEVAEKGLQSVVGGMFKTGLKEWGVEFAEENITSLSQILTDVVMGVETEDAKERLSTYLTKEMPELAAATWTSGFIGAGRKALETAKTPTATPEAPEVTESRIEATKEKMLEEGGVISETAQEEKRFPATTKIKAIEKPEVEKEVTEGGMEVGKPKKQKPTTAELDELLPALKKEEKVEPEKSKPDVEKKAYTGPERRGKAVEVRKEEKVPEAEKVAEKGKAPPQSIDEYLSDKKLRKDYRANYFDQSGKKIASSREVAAKQTEIPVGSWKIEEEKGIHGREISQLKMVDPNELIDVEKPEKYRKEDVERYKQWANEGLVPPPIEVVETTKGKLKIVDGHRRAVAAIQAGNKIPAWVSPIADHPQGTKDSSGKVLKVGLTYEMVKPKEKKLPTPEEIEKKPEAPKPKIVEKPKTIDEALKELNIKKYELEPGVVYTDGTQNVYNPRTGKTFRFNAKTRKLISIKDKPKLAKELPFKDSLTEVEKPIELKGTIDESIKKAKKDIPQKLWDSVELNISETKEGTDGQIYTKNGKLVVDLSPEIFNKWRVIDSDGNLIKDFNNKKEAYEHSKNEKGSEVVNRGVEVIFHELMGHAGASAVLDNNPKIAKRLKALYNSKSAGMLKGLIKKSYKTEFDGMTKEESEEALFSEWIAHNIEKHLTDPSKRGTAYKVTQAIKQFLIEMGWKKGDVEDAMESIVNEIRKTQSFEAKVEVEPGFAKELKPEAVKRVYGVGKAPKEVTPDKKAERKITRYFGISSDMKLAGYLREDGKMLDLSGRRQGNTYATERALDHREVSQFMDVKENKSNTADMQYFISLGNIRMDLNAGSLDISKKPSNKQKLAIRKFVRETSSEYINIDLQDGLGKLNKEGKYYRGERDQSLSYDKGIAPSRVVNDIDSYYRGEDVKNVSEVQQFRFAKELTPEPFFSPTERKISELKQEKGVVPQIESMIKKGQLKKAEVEWMGLEEWLSENPKATKTEVQDFVRANEVTVEEGEKGSLDILETAMVRGIPDIRNALVNLGYYEQKDIDKMNSVEVAKAADKILTTTDPKTVQTKYSQYTLPGGENYRELLFKMPVKYYPPPNNWIKKEKTYTSSHWDEPNVFAHARVNDRVTPEGEKVLFVEEIQSDQSRELRESAPLRKLFKPESVGKFVENRFGGHWPTSVSLSEMDAGVLTSINHNQVAREIVSFLPVDVVNDLGGEKAAIKNLTSNPAVILKPFSVDRRSAIAKGIVSATRKVGTRLRTKLSDAFKRGVDVELFPALSARNLSGRELVGLLSPGSIYHVQLLDKAIGGDIAGLGAEKAPVARGAKADFDRLPAVNTEFFNRPVSTGEGTKSSALKPAGFDEKLLTASVAELLEWHNNNISKDDGLKQIDYKINFTPPMPFETNWQEFTLKNLLKRAVSEGYDRVSWVTGEQTADRYDLSKQVNKIIYQPDTKKLIAYTGTGDQVLNQVAEADQLASIIGKEPAKRLLKQKISESPGAREQVIKGEELKIGAEWAKSLYDKMIPKFLDKYAKKWGAKVDEIDLNIIDETPTFNKDTGKDVFGISTQLSLPITPAMKESIQKTGQPMFAKELPKAKEEGIVYDSAGKPTETRKELFIRKIANKYNRLKKVEDIYAPELKKEESPYYGEERLPGITETKLEIFEEEMVKPLVKELIKTKTDLAELEDYAYAKHAPERNAHIDKINPEFKEKGISGSGMTNEQAAEIIQKAEKQGKTAKLDRLAQKLYDINSRARQLLVDSGLISEEMKKSWENYDYYVPLKGIDEEVTKPGTSRGFDIKKPTRRALGRKTKARDIMAQTLLQMQEAIVQSGRNEVAQNFLNFVRSNPDERMWVVDTPVKDRYFNTNTGEVDYYTKTIFSDQDIRKYGAPMRVWEEGKEHQILIKDPALQSAMLNIGEEKTGKILQNLAVFSRYFSLINTSLTPGFVATNLGRDVQTMMFNVTAEKMTEKDGKLLALKILKDVPKAIYNIGKELPGIEPIRKVARKVTGRKKREPSEWQKWFREFKAAGGKVGFLGLTDVDRIQNRIIEQLGMLGADVSEYLPKTVLQKTKNVVTGIHGKGKRRAVTKMLRGVGDLIMDINEAVENGTRLATYVNMRKRGMSKADAASIAKNITVNFNRKGELGSAMNAAYVFSNASIQGNFRMLKALKTRKGKIMGGSIIGGSLAAAQLMRLMGGKDDDDEDYYDKIPDYIKENNYIIMKPGIKTLNKEGFLDQVHYFKFPVPYGYNVFWATGQALDKVWHHHDKKSSLEAAGMITGSVANSFNPLGAEVRFTPQSLIRNVSPTVLRPIAELGFNENFYGAPIRKEVKFGVPTSRAHTYFKSASIGSRLTAKFFSDISGGSKYQPGHIDLSPDNMDYLFGFLTGGAGRTINQSINMAYSFGAKKDVPIRSIPILRRFVGGIPEYQDVQTMYDHADKLDKIRADYKHLLHTNPKKALKFKEKNKAALNYTYKPEGKPTRLNQYEKEVRDLRNKKKEADQVGREDLVKRYQAEILRVVKQFNKEFNQMVGK